MFRDGVVRPSKAIQTCILEQYRNAHPANLYDIKSGKCSKNQLQNRIIAKNIKKCTNILTLMGMQEISIWAQSTKEYLKL